MEERAITRRQGKKRKRKSRGRKEAEGTKKGLCPTRNRILAAPLDSDRFLK